MIDLVVLLPLFILLYKGLEIAYQSKKIKAAYISIGLVAMISLAVVPIIYTNIEHQKLETNLTALLKNSGVYGEYTNVSVVEYEDGYVISCLVDKKRSVSQPVTKAEYQEFLQKMKKD
ncbi:hypothetical protein [Listeria floridensis]|nr:hypothetical protein [Listeria floridensis]